MITIQDAMTRYCMTQHQKSRRQQQDHYFGQEKSRDTSEQRHHSEHADTDRHIGEGLKSE